MATNINILTFVAYLNYFKYYLRVNIIKILILVLMLLVINKKILVLTKIIINTQMEK